MEHCCWRVATGRCRQLQGGGGPSLRGTGASTIPTNYKTAKRIQQPGARIVCLSNGPLQFAEHHLKMRLDTLIPAVVDIASIY